MEVLGGFMVMLSIIGFFLTVIWFILPFVIFSIKGKVDRTQLMVEDVERRLAAIEERLLAMGSAGAEDISRRTGEDGPAVPSGNTCTEDQPPAAAEEPPDPA